MYIFFVNRLDNSAFERKSEKSLDADETTSATCNSAADVSIVSQESSWLVRTVAVMLVAGMTNSGWMAATDGT